MARNKVVHGPRSWERVSELYEKLHHERLSPQRIGQIGRLAEEKIKIALVDVAVEMGVISNDEAERIAESSAAVVRCISTRGGGSMGTGSASEFQLLLPFSDCFVGADACAD